MRTLADGSQCVYCRFDFQNCSALMPSNSNLFFFYKSLFITIIQSKSIKNIVAVTKTKQTIIDHFGFFSPLKLKSTNIFMEKVFFLCSFQFEMYYIWLASQSTVCRQCDTHNKKQTKRTTKRSYLVKLLFIIFHKLNGK